MNQQNKVNKEELIDEELIKEVYVRFGVAYYQSECLHREMCNLYTVSGFTSKEQITRPRVEEKMKFAVSLTLGQLAQLINNFLPAHLQKDLNDAVEKRNFLAHSFWFERCHLMFSESGLLQLRKELIAAANFFETVEAQLGPFFLDMTKDYLEEEVLEQALQDVINGEAWKPFSEKRFPKKKERLIHAWRVPIGEDKVSPIFQSEDGTLWQLCDVGLGWTYLVGPQEDWKVAEEIQKFLPAIVPARPPRTSPWNYEIPFSDSAYLWVSKKENDSPDSFRYGIRKINLSSNSSAL